MVYILVPDQSSISSEEMVHKCRKKNIKFCSDKSIIKFTNSEGEIIEMTKKQNLTEYIQFRVSEKEKAFIQLMSKKHSSKSVSALIISLLYDELSRVSLFDEELSEARKQLMKI